MSGVVCFSRPRIPARLRVPASTSHISKSHVSKSHVSEFHVSEFHVSEFHVSESHVTESQSPRPSPPAGSRDRNNDYRYFLISPEIMNSSRGAFCPVNFSLIRETAGMCLRRFPARESRKKRSSKILRKKQWFEYLRQPFFSFLLL